jgi:predicted amidophosphoribosyltransferase
MVKCPYCGKELTENENFCWNCENDVSEVKDKMEKPESDSKK